MDKTKVYSVSELIKELKQFDGDSVVVFRLVKGEGIEEKFEDYDEVLLIDQYSDGSLRIDISEEEYIK